MFPRFPWTLSPSKRRQKRRRSRSEEKRPLKKQERPYEVATCSESSQSTHFHPPQSLRFDDENQPPLRSEVGTSDVLGSEPPEAPSCYDGLGEGRVQFHERTNDVVGPSRCRTERRESMGEAPTEPAPGMSLENSVSSAAWSLHPGDEIPDEAEEVTSPEQEMCDLPDNLCEELRRSLTLEMDIDEERHSICEGKRCFADYMDDHTSLPDDGLDAFEDEEWTSTVDVPPYPVGLDFEE